MSTSSDEVKIQKIEKSGGLLAGLKDKAKEWKDAADEEDNSTEEIESESDAKKTMFRTISNFTLSITHEYDSEDLKDYYLKMNVSQDDIFELKTEIGKTLALIKKYTKNEEISKIQDNIDDISTTDIDIVLQDNLRISLPIVETLDEHLFYKPNSKVVKDITQYAKMLSTLFNDKKGTVENEIKAFINEFIDADVKDNAYIEILQTKKFLSEKMEAAKQEWKKKNSYLGMSIEYPYSIEDNILYINRKTKDGENKRQKISRAFIIEGFGESNENDANQDVNVVKLSWINIDGEVKSLWINEGVIYDHTWQKQELQPLSIVGSRRNELMDYYDSLLLNNKDKIENINITLSSGWKNDFTSYVTGDKTFLYDENCKSYLLSSNNTHMANVHQCGTLDKWIEGAYRLYNDDAFAFQLWVGIVAALQSMLCIPNFAIINTDDSSSGKTTAAKFRNSIFGHPFEMMITANSSKLGILNILYMYRDVPSHVDEITKDDIEKVSKMFYTTSDSKERNVAAQAGGNKKQGSGYVTNTVYTTEEQLLSNTSKRGQQARVMKFLKTPKRNVEGIKAFQKLICSKTGVCKNYGTPLELLIPAIMDKYHSGKLVARYEEVLGEFQNTYSNESGVVDRIADYYAGTVVAGEIFNEIIVACPENKDRLVEHDVTKVVKEMLELQIETNPDETEATKAMLSIIDWYNGNKLRFNEPKATSYTNDDGSEEFSQAKIEFFGYDKKDTIEIFIYKVKEVLNKEGFNYDTIVNAWLNEGYTNGEKSKGKTLATKRTRILADDKEFVANNEDFRNKIGKSQQVNVISINKDKIQHMIVDIETSLVNGIPKDRLAEPKKLNLNFKKD